jgi:hypothetical protein
MMPWNVDATVTESRWPVGNNSYTMVRTPLLSLALTARGIESPAKTTTVGT